MITLDDLYEKYGKDIVFLFKGQEPFTEMLGCPGGVLIERDDKVLCYECETWHESLGVHLHQQHNMTADEYKEKYGFNRSAPLCARKVSETLREKSIAALERDSTIAVRAAYGRKKARERYVANGFHQGAKRIQASNARNSCPEQIKQRYRLLQLKYGNDVSLNVIRNVDSGVEKWAVAHYGSWNKFKEAIGEPIDTSSYAKNTADLIYDLRDYVSKYGRKPWDVYTHKRLDGFPHSKDAYEGRFKTISNAFLVAGITSEYQVIDGRPRKKYLIETGVDEKYIQMAEMAIRRLSASPYAVKMPAS